MTRPLSKQRPLRGTTGTAVWLGLSALILGSTGCSPSAPAPEAPRYKVEIETVEDQARAAIEETPLQFTVPLAGADEAWARARLFISTYTSGDGMPHEISPRRAFVTNAGVGEERFDYRIDRTVTPHGYAFVVTSTPRHSAALNAIAEHNGRNIARFIREGTLEVSLLSR